MRLARRADVPSVKQQPVVSPWNILRGYIFYQFLFYLERCGSTLSHQSKAVAYAENMRVDSHSGMAESHREHDISRFPAYPWQRQ